MARRPIIAVSGYDPAFGETEFSRGQALVFWGALLALGGVIFWASLQPPKRK